MDQALQLHQILKYLFQWSIENKRSNLASHWVQLGVFSQKIRLKEIPFTDLMVITKGWNANRHLKLLEEKEARIRENQATIQAMEEQLDQKGHALIPSGSQEVDQPNSPVASHYSEAADLWARVTIFYNPMYVPQEDNGQGQEQDFFQPEAERVIPNDTEALGLCEEVHKSQK
ncbi:hypothetical protein O181_019171 [Austropuccinia psidii MF-1]|uniref:Uncharacterized protein n=1 Tax=Austropuccinia psidii MF-1 TaxID=1389203 RepID=A0A9Q3GTL4_9BASI|nr:hypothetical protein [Austropuccinia psidii MF-1]